jgi:hypothetical protein
LCAIHYRHIVHHSGVALHACTTMLLEHFGIKYFQFQVLPFLTTGTFKKLSWAWLRGKAALAIGMPSNVWSTNSGDQHSRHNNHER